MANKGEPDVLLHPGWTGPNATFKTCPDAPMTPSQFAVQATIMTGVSSQLMGAHGIAKSAEVMAYAPIIMERNGYENGRALLFAASTTSSDDHLAAAPVMGEDGEYRLIEILSQFFQDNPGNQPTLLVVDDPRQASPLVQNQLMQLASEWKLGRFDLRDYGVVGVVFIDNPSLTETAQSMEDLAQADRFNFFVATDTAMAPSVKIYLANKHPELDLSAAFAVRDSLPPQLRHILSWRTFDQMVDTILAGLPGHLSIPYVDGAFKWLTVHDEAAGRTVDRTKEVISNLSSALGMPYTEKARVEDVLNAAIRNGWPLRLIAPHGVGKTMSVEALVKELGLKLVKFSLPTVDWDSQICPFPNRRGSLDMLLSSELACEDPKVVFIDEASRPKDMLSFVRGNELIHERSLGGVKIPNLVTVIAAENPPEFMGYRYDVQGGNISHADRYHLTLVLDSGDIDSYGWLVNSLPVKMAEDAPHLYGHRVDEIRTVAELVVEWHRSDLDNDGRAWVSPRNLERIIRAYMANIPLENTKLWLGEGERAPVSLTLLEARLSGREMTGLRELTANLSSWVSKLAAASAADTGMAATDAVHTAFVNADTDLLWEHAETVAALVKYIPPMMKVAYFNIDDADRQKFWMLAVAVASGKSKVDVLKTAREARKK